MTQVFVDESGDLGLKGERFFVMALIIPQNNKRLKNIVKKFCAKQKCPEMKASRATLQQKSSILHKLASLDDHAISYIVVDKRQIYNDRLFQDKNLFYNYIFQWLIKPIIKSNTGDIEIILDNHTTKVKSINSLCDYIKLKAYTEWGFKSKIDIKYMNSIECKTIQIADLAANIVYGKYLYGKDDLYKMLKIDRSIKFPHGTFNSNPKS